MVNAKADCFCPSNTRMLRKARSIRARNLLVQVLVLDATGNVTETATTKVFEVHNGKDFIPITIVTSCQNAPARSGFASKPAARLGMAPCSRTVPRRAIARRAGPGRPGVSGAPRSTGRPRPPPPGPAPGARPPRGPRPPRVFRRSRKILRARERTRQARLAACTSRARKRRVNGALALLPDGASCAMIRGATTREQRCANSLWSWTTVANA